LEKKKEPYWWGRFKKKSEASKQAFKKDEGKKAQQKQRKTTSPRAKKERNSPGGGMPLYCYRLDSWFLKKEFNKKKPPTIKLKEKTLPRGKTVGGKILMPVIGAEPFAKGKS